MVLGGQDFPPDIRVEKEARTLAEAGHEVTIVCESRTRPTGAGSWEGCRVLRLPTRSAGARLADIVRVVAMRDPRFQRALEREAATTDVFHVHDLPLVKTALAVATPRGLPVIADLHENYPAALDSYRLDGPRWRAAALDRVSGIRRWEAYERDAVRRADRVLVVVDEAKERLVAAGAPADRITVVENAEDVGRFLAIPVEPVTELQDATGAFVLLYVGSFGGSHRGLDTAIQAMPAILAERPDALLVLVGDGPMKPRLEQITADLSLERSVRFLAWQPMSRVPSLIAASDVCLVPHAAHPHTEATSPHKLYQYMLMGKPVVVSSCRPLARVIRDGGGGVVFEAGSPGSLASAVLSLTDPDRRRALGEAGRAAATSTYNWARSAERLLGVYGSLA